MAWHPLVHPLDGWSTELAASKLVARLTSPVTKTTQTSSGSPGSTKTDGYDRKLSVVAWRKRCGLRLIA